MSSFHETQINSLSLQPLQETPSSEMYVSLTERLEREAERARENAREQAHERVWELARRQGVRPIHNLEDLKGDFWPEEESTDDFLSWLRALRQNDKPRSIPE